MPSLLPALLLGLFLSPARAGSPDTEVTTGVVAFNGQDYRGAIEALETALQKQGELKPANVAKAQLYLGMAYTRVEPDGSSAVLALVPLAACRKAGDRTAERCVEALESAARSAQNHVIEQASAGDIDGARRGAGLIQSALAGEWFGAFTLGTVELLAGHNAAALPLLDAAWNQVVDGPGTDVVHPVSLLQLRAATIGRLRGLDAGLDALAEGQALLVSRADAELGEIEMIEHATESVREELRELDATLAPHRAAAAAPDATAEQLRIWAQLQAQLGRDAAAEATYRTATERFPTDHAAWHDLGAQLFNRAVGVDDPAVIIGHMKAARGPFERALALDPQSASALQALVQITSVLGDDPAFETYSAQLQALTAP
ncbi:MAG: hypothetical protein H6742_13250 [Alphaproteobacteria bacterium]|nr:hypothetical protein [Alphaproteobacteria bacterium]